MKNKDITIVDNYPNNWDISNHIFRGSYYWKPYNQDSLYIRRFVYPNQDKIVKNSFEEEDDKTFTANLAFDICNPKLQTYVTQKIMARKNKKIFAKIKVDDDNDDYEKDDYIQKEFTAHVNEIMLSLFFLELSNCKFLTALNPVLYRYNIVAIDLKNQILMCIKNRRFYIVYYYDRIYASFKIDDIHRGLNIHSYIKGYFLFSDKNFPKVKSKLLPKEEIPSSSSYFMKILSSTFASLFQSWKLEFLRIKKDDDDDDDVNNKKYNNNSSQWCEPKKFLKVEKDGKYPIPRKELTRIVFEDKQGFLNRVVKSLKTSYFVKILFFVFTTFLNYLSWNFGYWKNKFLKIEEEKYPTPTKEIMWTTWENKQDFFKWTDCKNFTYIRYYIHFRHSVKDIHKSWKDEMKILDENKSVNHHHHHHHYKYSIKELCQYLCSHSFLFLKNDLLIYHNVIYVDYNLQYFITLNVDENEKAHFKVYTFQGEVYEEFKCHIYLEYEYGTELLNITYDTHNI